MRAKTPGKDLHQQRLCCAGRAFDQRMAFAEDCDKHLLYDRILADYGFSDLGLYLLHDRVDKLRQ
jgi:hypothetical protein